MGAQVATGEVWYSDGLKFTCTRCGACCSGEPGYVWVTTREIAAMAREMDMEPGAFRRRFVRRVFGRRSLKEHDNGDCVMMSGTGCAVYDSRPPQCRTFPFWPENLRASQSWERYTRHCPGVGRGRLWTPGEIRAVAQGRGDATSD